MQNDLLIPTKIIKSKRKSISLIIKNNGDFIVRAPLNVKDKKIIDFINKKADWIIIKRKEQLEHAFMPLTVKNNEKLYIFGQLYNIKLTETSRVKLVENDILVPLLSSKEKLIKFLKKFLKKYIETRTIELSNQFNFSFNGISISSAKTCWGSCSFKNKLHFTYKLVFCPKSIIDYIIIHELCHTKIKNHSSSFWNLVKTYYPNYKNCEKWLKDNRGITELI